jgi:hypothetical protein
MQRIGARAFGRYSLYLTKQPWPHGDSNHAVQFERTNPDDLAEVKAVAHFWFDTSEFYPFAEIFDNETRTVLQLTRAEYLASK